MAIIGVFDSGLGGLTVLGRLLQDFPQHRFVYFGDTARTPYGSKTPETITRYAHECANFLLEQGAEAIVVACNTASSCALDSLSASLPVPVIGTVEPLVAELALVKLENPTSGPIAVLGTRATIASEVYQKAIAAKLPGRHILARACPMFVSLVEEGIVEGAVVDEIIKLYCSGLLSEGVDTVVLGCTHYPLLKKSLENFFPPRTLFYSSASGISSALSELCLTAEKESPALDQKERIACFVSDEVSRFNYLSAQVLADLQIEAKKAVLG